MTPTEWLMQNWEALIAAAGIGGGGGILGKKLTDKHQDRKIEANRKSLEMAHQRIDGLQKQHLIMQSQIELNTALDKEFRVTFSEHRKQMQRDIESIKDSLTMLTQHLLNK